MTKKEIDSIEGVVIEALPNTLFRVELDDGREVLSYISGKMRMNRIRILVGDRVKLELPPQEDNRGRIVYRYK
ncbi:MAG: translation initiation factor IF-1 [Candidatus Spechtbacterales bacterium]